MRVITAPETFSSYPEDGKITKVFLAGGITNCINWQKKLIERAKELKYPDTLVLYNPRRENFPIDDPTASDTQIKWEFDAIEDCDIFSMYFCAGISDQPICMYELGRNIVRMQTRFPIDWHKRIIITVEEGYKRINDVMIQTKLAVGNWVFPKIIRCTDDLEFGIMSHLNDIIFAYKYFN